MHRYIYLLQVLSVISFLFLKCYFLNTNQVLNIYFLYLKDIAPFSFILSFWIEDTWRGRILFPGRVVCFRMEAIKTKKEKSMLLSRQSRHMMKNSEQQLLITKNNQRKSPIKIKKKKRKSQTALKLCLNSNMTMNLFPAHRIIH